MFPRNKNFLKGEALRSHKFNSEIARPDPNPSSSIVLNLLTKWLIQFQSISSKQGKFYHYHRHYNFFIKSLLSSKGMYRTQKD